MDRLVEQEKLVFNGEIDRIVDSPFLNTAPYGIDTDDVKTSIRAMLFERMVLSAEEIKKLFMVVLQSIFDRWTVEPISIRQASDEPEHFASTIFTRAASVILHPNDHQYFDLDVIAQVCNVSSLDSLAKAVLLERNLGVDSIDVDAFMVVVRRFVMLKNHYRIGRELVVSEGTARTIDVAKPDPVEKPVLVKAPIVSSVPISIEKDEPVEQPPAPPEGNIVLVPDMEFLSPELTSRGGRDVHNVHVSPSTPVEIPDVINESCVHLYALLMTPKRREFLGDQIFDDNFGAYDQMVYKTCRQRNVQHALTVADNELYHRDIPASAIPAAELLRTIKSYYGKEGF
ncbi:MAG: hypothetical protein P9M15_02455 [Candidatus Electryoneaceae bacterium]|nr:hypothetical protein [Candidatus Electryoneaceae bacterium]